MIKNTIVIIIFLSLLATVRAQQSYNCENKVLAKSLEEKLTGIVVSQLPDNKQFYSNDWSKAIVTLKDGNTVGEEYIRYNGFQAKFVWLKKSTNQQIILNDEDFSKVDLSSGKLLTSGIFERKNVKHWFDIDSVPVFLEVLAQGPISLYAERKIGNNSNSIEYTSEYQYFIRLANGPLSAIKPRKKALLGALGAFENDCKLALNKAKLSVGNEYDLIRVVEYLNESVDFGKVGSVGLQK